MASVITDVVAKELELRTRRQPYASAVVVWAQSPTSGHTGDRALVTVDGQLHGWVGGSCSEPVVTREALAALTDGEPRMLHLGPAETVPSGRPPSGRPGTVAVPVACASEGELEVFIQPNFAAPRVVGVGNAPMVRALAAMSAAVGYDSAVVERGPEGLDLGPVDARSAVVVATFGRYDEDALEAALATDASYVGLVASAKRAATVWGNLRADGMPDDQLARVHAPAGLDLGALSHTEIAVPILADIVPALGSRSEDDTRGGVQSGPGEMPGTQPAASPDEAIDPVCGMTVDRSRTMDRVTYEGVEYAFCCAGCRRRFEADPATALPIGSRGG